MTLGTFMKLLALCGYPANGLGGGGGVGLKSAGVLAQSAVPASVTGTLTPTTLASIPIPANALGPNGVLRVTLRWSTTNSANGKTLQVQIGGVNLTSFSTANNSSYRDTLSLECRNSQSSQIGRPNTSALAFGGGGSTANTAFSFNFGQAQTLTAIATLTNTGETVTLESYTVEILNP